MAASAAYGDDELAALYDLEYGGFDDDVAMYDGLAARCDAPSLELGVGSGRVALRLARTGRRVYGIDTSPTMLARLAAAARDGGVKANVRAARADMRDFALDERFGLVYCALNSFEQMLTAADALAALRRVRAHLDTGGLFVAELRTLRAVDWSVQEQGPVVHEWSVQDGADTVTKLSSLRAAPIAQTTTTTYIFDRAGADGAVRRRTFDVTQRVYGKQEFELLLGEAGLRAAQWYGGHDLSPLSDDSDSMIVVAEGEGT